MEWLSEKPLDHNGMTDAERLWKEFFEQEQMNQHTYEKVKAYRAQDTRQSKNKARKLLNGAFNAYLMQTYGLSQVAKFFLKFPLAALDNLLDHWSDYRKSPEYINHKQRSQRARSMDPADAQRRKEESELKHRIHRLKATQRHAKSLVKRVENGSLEQVPAQHQQVVQSFLDGSMAQELDELVWLHGYGKLSDGSMLYAPLIAWFS